MPKKQPKPPTNADAATLFDATPPSDLPDLPAGWKWVKLSDVLQCLESGKRPKGGVQGITHGVPSIGGEHLNADGGFDFEHLKFVPRDYAEAMTKGKIEKGDILIVKDGATTGKTSFVSEDFPFEFAVINEHVFRCKVSKEVIPKYAFFYLWSEEGKKQILSDFRGAAQGGISKRFAHKVKIPLPPLEEQRRIVAVLEEKLGAVARGVAKLEEERARLKRYRQSVLKAAFSGRLLGGRVEGEMPSLFDATPPSDLPDLPAGWKWVKLGKIVDFVRGISFPKEEKISDKREGFVACLRTANVQADVDWEDLWFVPMKYVKRTEQFVREKDILISIANSLELLGKVSFVKSVEVESTFGTFIAVIRCKDFILPEALFHYLSSVDFKKNVQKNASTTTNISNISVGKLENILIPLPPLEEQRAIVEAIEARFRGAEALERAIEKGLREAARLRQSLLRQAFSGKLV